MAGYAFPCAVNQAWLTGARVYLLFRLSDRAVAGWVSPSKTSNWEVP